MPTVPRSSYLGRSRCSVKVTRMPMARGSIPGKFPVSLSWYVSHLGCIWREMMHKKRTKKAPQQKA